MTEANNNAIEDGDAVLREIWRAKETLSAENDHDLDKLFRSLREKERNSDHPIVNYADRVRRR
jgi:hypothetical protein